MELQVLRELYPPPQLTLDIEHLVRVNVSQFYGIEIGEFPARIAEVALWMMDHIANNRVSLEFGQVYLRIPIRVSPHIHCADALEIDWKDVLPAESCDYLFGNPPFIGAKYQSTIQRDQVRYIAQLGGSGGTLDYVTAWFLKAGVYARSDDNAGTLLAEPRDQQVEDLVSAKKTKIGFVATNSITQGEQMAQLYAAVSAMWTGDRFCSYYFRLGKRCAGNGARPCRDIRTHTSRRRTENETAVYLSRHQRRTCGE